MKNLLNKLDNKYNYKPFLNKDTIQVGNLLNVRTSKGKLRRVFLGILLKYRKNKNNYTITLRNSYKRYSFEKTFYLNSRKIKEIRFLKNVKYSTKRNNLFFLRRRKRTFSTF